jgi:hypothetical protein
MQPVSLEPDGQPILATDKTPATGVLFFLDIMAGISYNAFL